LFLSQQSVLSVYKRGRENEEAEALSDSIMYLGNRILCIFRQPLKYLCFSYSFLDGVRKYHIGFRNPIVKNVQETIMQVGILEQHSTNGGLSWFVAVSRVNSKCCREKSCQ
jgi:hypothetical protein